MVPINYILLGFITFSEAYLLSMICAEYTPESVFQAFMLTTSAFVGTSIYAVTTKHDITIFYSIMWGSVFLFFGVMILMLFTSSPAIRLTYFFFGALFALFYVVIDTQMIMKNRKYGISYDDYIIGALILYLDFIQLFLEILRLFGDRK